MRVLISGPSLDANRNVSGISTVVMQLMGSLRGRVRFIHLEAGAEQNQRAFKRIAMSFLRSLRALWKVLSCRYELFHSNTAFDTPSIVRDLVFVLAARFRGKPVLLHVHGGLYVHKQAPILIRLAIRLHIALAKKIVMLSHLESLYLNENFPGSRGRTFVLYNSVDARGFKRSRQRSSVLRAVFVGRLVERKGIAILLECSGMLPREIEVTIYGQGPLLGQVVRSAGLIEGLSYEGVFKSNKTLDIISKFDVLVLPSIEGEGMPMAIVEAMAVGTVPICTPISSIPEIIKHNHTGCLIKATAESLCQALIDLNANRDRLERMSVEAQEFAVSQFDAKSNHEKLFVLYSNFLGRSSALVQPTG